MTGLTQHVGSKFKDVFGYSEEEKTYVKPDAFGEREITGADVAAAFPQSVTGLINTAAMNYELVSLEEVGLLEDA